MVQRAVIYTGLLVLTILAFPGTETYEIGSRIQEGDIWMRDDVIAPMSFPVLKSNEVFQAEVESIRNSEPPVFREVRDAAAITQARLDSIDVQLDTIVQSYADWQDGLLREEYDSVEADSLQYIQLRQIIGLDLTAAEWDLLLTS